MWFTNPGMTSSLLSAHIIFVEPKLSNWQKQNGRKLSPLYDANQYNFVNIHPILMILVCNIMFSWPRNTIMKIKT